jgi:hypothetical protein
MSRPIDYAAPSVEQPLPPLWQRVVAWAMVWLATALVLYAAYLYRDLNSVLFMPH